MVSWCPGPGFPSCLFFTAQLWRALAVMLFTVPPHEKHRDAKPLHYFNEGLREVFSVLHGSNQNCFLSPFFSETHKMKCCHGISWVWLQSPGCVLLSVISVYHCTLLSTGARFVSATFAVSQDLALKRAPHLGGKALRLGLINTFWTAGLTRFCTGPWKLGSQFCLPKYF